jgi:hypothetical protein
MIETVLGDVIARMLVFADLFVDQLVTGVTYTEGNVLNCTPATFTGGSLTTCGAAIVELLPLARILDYLAEQSQRVAVALTV